MTEERNFLQGVPGTRLAKRLQKKLERAVAALTAEIIFSARPQTVYLGDHEALTRLYTGHKIYVDTRDVSICSHLMLDGRWEPWIERILMDLIKPGMTVLDIGANFGYYTLLAAAKVGPQGHVYAFEANPHIVELLRKSVAANGFPPRTTVIGKAAYSHSDSLELIFTHTFSGGGSVMYHGDPSRSEAPRVKVEAVAVDDVVPPDVRVDVAKIDVEGAEVLVIRGMTRVLERSRSICIVMEFFPPAIRKSADPAGFLTGFSDAGFTMQVIGVEGVSERLDAATLLQRLGEKIGYVLFRRVA